MAVGGNFTACGCGPDSTTCESPTEPVATVGLCLSDGSPIAVTVVRDCAGTTTSEGWINLVSGTWSAGAPPAGVVACGDSRSIQVSGTFCDIAPDTREVLGLVLVEYSYAADGSIDGVRLVDAVTGETYVPEGEVTTCPAGVEQPERDLLQLCDTDDDESGAAPAVVPFLRDFARDENGAVVGHSDYTLDGEPYTPVGVVGVCQEQPECATACETLPLCDTPLDTSPAPVLLAGGQAGARSGTTSTGVGWAASSGTNSGAPDWFPISLFPVTAAGPFVLTLDRPVSATWSARVGVTGTNVGRIVMPPGSTLVELSPLHEYDPATRTLSPAAGAGMMAANGDSRFAHPGPVSALTFPSDGAGGLAATQRSVGAFQLTPATVPFLRITCRDCTGLVVVTTDALLDGTPYVPVGTVGVCQPPETEPCASTVSTLRLCDLNPDVEPDDQGKRCATPFLRHMVHDCTGILAETRDTAMDGTTLYTPVEIVDCGAGGVPALVEVPWSVVSVEPDPDEPAGRGYLFTLSPDDDPDTVGVLKVTTSTVANTTCAATFPNLAFSNPCTYTYTPDQVLKETATYIRVDLGDFDTFEPVGSFSPRPDRIGGTAYWDGATLRPTESNGTGLMFYDGPPDTWSFRIGNTGGGTSCSGLSFAAVSLRAEGCCSCGSSSSNEPCRDSSTFMVCDLPTDQADGEATATDTDATAYPWDADPIRCVNAHLGGGGALWGGGELTIPAQASGAGACVGSQVLVGVAALLQADRPACDDGTVTVTVSIDARNNGPSASAANYAGSLRLHRTDTGARLAASSVQLGSTLPGQTRTMTVTATVDAELLDAGQLVAVVDVEVWDQTGNTGAAWTLANFAPSYVYGQEGCEQQFLRRIVTDCETGATVAVTDTTLDGAPYEVTGEVGQCRATGGETTRPCQHCQTVPLCDQPTADELEGGTSGVLASGVEWTLTSGQPVAGEPWWEDGPAGRPGFVFSEPVSGAWSMRLPGGDACWVLPDGAVPVTVDPGHIWDPTTRRLCSVPGTGTAASTSVFATSEPVTELAFETASGMVGGHRIGMLTVTTAATPEPTEFLRTFCRDCDGALLTVTDTSLDGAPYEVQGQTGQCRTQGGGTEQPCRSSSSVLLCDAGGGLHTEAIPLATLPAAPPVQSGTLPNGVGWSVDKGEWYQAQGHYAIYPADNPQTWTFDQPVGVRFGIRGLNVSPQECVAIPDGFELETLGAGHTWDPETRRVCGKTLSTVESTFVSTAPVTGFPISVYSSPTAGSGISFVEATIGSEPVQFLRTITTDCDGQTIATTDTTLDGEPYTVTGEVGECQTQGGTCCPPTTRADTELLHLCFLDEAAGEVLQRVLAEYAYDTATGDRVGERYVDLATGEPVEVPDGAVVGVCGDQGEPCRDSSSTLLCDTAAQEALTVFDPANRPGSDGWQVVSYTGVDPAYPAEAALPYDAPHPAGSPSMGARSDLNAGAGGGWSGYDTAPHRWVLRKTVQAPEDGIAVVTSAGFRGDGGARVRVNGVDAGMYGQWNQPATSGTAQIPVTAGPNVVEIEVRDSAGPNYVQGRLDIVMTATVQFMRRTVVDCETGETVAVIDTTLDGEPYEVTGLVGQCEPVAECCEQPPPEQRVDVESDVLCIQDADGEIVRQVLVERVYDDQSGDRTDQRLTDPTTGEEVELPAGAELVLCQEPACPVAFSTECVGAVTRTEAGYDNTSLIGGIPGKCGSVQGPGGQFPCQPTTGGLTITSWIVDGEEVIGEGGGRTFNGGPCGDGTTANPGMHRNWALALTNLDPGGATWSAMSAEGCAWFVGSTGGTGTVYGSMTVQDAAGQQWILGPAQACEEIQYTKVYTQECDGTVSVSWLTAEGVETSAPEGDLVPCGTGCGSGGGRGLDVETLTLCDVQDDGSVPFLRHLTYGSAGQVTVVVDTALDGFAPYTPVGTVTVCQPRQDGQDVELLAMCVLDNTTGQAIQHIVAEVRYDAQTGERTGVTYVDPLTWEPVALPGGTHIGLCPETEEPEPAPDVEVVQLCDLVDAEPVPFLRHLVYAPGAATPTVVDSALDGVTPYTVAGTVGACRSGEHVVEQCRCDDTDGDGIGDTDYVELLAVDTAAGTLATIGTYLPDYSAPYTPVAPAECEVEGADPVTVIRARRVEVSGGGSWSAAGVPLLQSVTATAHDGPATITTEDGPTVLHEGESVSWSIVRDGDAYLSGPLTISAGSTGSVAVTFTAAATA